MPDQTEVRRSADESALLHTMSEVAAHSESLEQALAGADDAQHAALRGVRFSASA